MCIGISGARSAVQAARFSGLAAAFPDAQKVAQNGWILLASVERVSYIKTR
jgi:hypothetical protein